MTLKKNKEKEELRNSHSIPMSGATLVEPPYMDGPWDVVSKNLNERCCSHCGQPLPESQGNEELH